MAKKVDLGKALTPEDRRYLLDRNRVEEVEENEARFGRQSGLSRAQRDERIVELESDLLRLRMENAREDNPNVANPTPGIGGGVRDNTSVDGKPPAGAPVEVKDDYDDDKKWTAAKLRDLLVARNEDRQKDELEPLPTTGTKAELIERLRRDDEEIRLAQQADQAQV